MAKQIFRLRGVPDDEAEDIRILLTEHHFDFYETPGGNWGISMPALWLVDDEREQAAKALITEYQTQRFKRARATYEQLKQEGNLPTIVGRFRENPGQFVFYLAGVIALIYFSTMPFIDAGK